jgi:hypothetical protein
MKQCLKEQTSLLQAQHHQDLNRPGAIVFSVPSKHIGSEAAFIVVSNSDINGHGTVGCSRDSSSRQDGHVLHHAVAGA